MPIQVLATNASKSSIVPRSGGLCRVHRRPSRWPKGDPGSPGRGRLLFGPAVHRSHRMDRGQIHHVESHLGDDGQSRAASPEYATAQGSRLDPSLRGNNTRGRTMLGAGRRGPATARTSIPDPDRVLRSIFHRDSSRPAGASRRCQGSVAQTADRLVNTLCGREPRRGGRMQAPSSSSSSRPRPPES